jgi:hypothetical protein
MTRKRGSNEPRENPNDHFRHFNRRLTYIGNSFSWTITCSNLRPCLIYNYFRTVELAQIAKLTLPQKSMSESTGKVGRPALSNKEKRGKFISTRLSPPEYEEIEAAIKSSGDSKTEWVRKKLIAAARRA